MGRNYAFVQISTPQIAVKALKKAERSDQIVLRLQEQYGLPVNNATIRVGSGFISARELNGSEQDIGPATLSNGALVVSITANQPKTYALSLSPAPAAGILPIVQSVILPYNLDAISFDTNRTDGDFEQGNTFPGELFPVAISCNDIAYVMGSSQEGQMNALLCDSQTINLPEGYDTLYILATSRNGDTKGTFTVNDVSYELSIQDYNEPVADWGREGDVPYIKYDPVAWIGTHRHNPSSNESYEFCCLYKYQIDLPDGATSFTLPDNDRIVIFAMTVATHPNGNTRMAAPLYDQLPYIPELAPLPENLGDNLALNKPVTANSYVNDAEQPRLSVDGKDSTKWCAATGKLEPHWLTVDLGEIFWVDTFIVRHAGAGGETSSWNTKDFSIQSSADGINDWLDIITVSGNNKNVSKHVIDSTPIRYIRLYITAPTQNTDTAARIYEFEVYGRCNGKALTGDISGPQGRPDCYINLYDFSTIALDWLACNDPQDNSCHIDYGLTAASLEQPLDTEQRIEPIGISQDPIAHWKLNESQGQIAEDSALPADNGTLGAREGYDPPQWATGWIPAEGSDNHALRFTDFSYVRVSPDTSVSPNLNTIQDQITIAAWINADNWNGNRRIVQKGSSDNQYRLLAEWGALKFHLSGVGEVTTDLPSAGLWHHIAGIYDGSMIKLYVDGIEQAIQYASGLINQTTNTLYIGTKSRSVTVAGDYFLGTIDDLRIYDTALSDSEIAGLALMGQNVPPTVSVAADQSNIEISMNRFADLTATIFDLNGDPVACRWTVEDSDPAVRANVSFLPDNSAKDVRVSFSQSGTYTLRLSIDDGTAGYLHGQNIFDEVTFTVENMDCTSIYSYGYDYAGDIDRNCHIDLQDLTYILMNWLDCRDPENTKCD